MKFLNTMKAALAAAGAARKAGKLCAEAAEKTLSAWADSYDNGEARRYGIESDGEVSHDAAVFVWQREDERDQPIPGKWDSGVLFSKGPAPTFQASSREEAMALVDAWLLERGYELLSTEDTDWLGRRDDVAVSDVLRLACELDGDDRR